MDLWNFSLLLKIWARGGIFRQLGAGVLSSKGQGLSLLAPPPLARLDSRAPQCVCEQGAIDRATLNAAQSDPECSTSGPTRSSV